MERVLERIARHARNQPGKTALVDSEGSLSYGALYVEIEQLAALLSGERVGLLLGNSRAWAVIDLALLRRGATALPIPPFFSDGQIAHLLADAAPQLVLTDQPERLAALLQRPAAVELAVAGRTVAVFALRPAANHRLPAGTAKLTYTSGTTGQPKGVCLSGAAIAEVVIALGEAVGASAEDRSLSLLPLSTLLENIGGLYAPLYHGATAALPDLADCGFTGSSEVDPQRLLAALHRYAPSSIILVPQLLKLLVAMVTAGHPLPGSLRFIAVGGAPCSPALIRHARELGLPAHEGYGLSEATSVVSLNRPDARRDGSVGRPLPRVQVRVAEDGEVMVAGGLFHGYLGGAPHGADEWATGDLGFIDQDGYLHITGRKKTAYASAFGRNIAPEWVERELTADRAVAQAVVFGEARPYNVALLVPHPTAGSNQVEAAVAAANARLPDYARVRAWRVAPTPFTLGNGLARAAGTPDRAAIARRFARELDSLYEGEQHDVAI